MTISLVSQKLFSKIDNNLANNLQHNDDDFGGVSVIIVGDFRQLPPVSASSLFKKPLVSNSAISTWI